VAENAHDVIEIGTATAIKGRGADIVDMKLEVVIIPVSDVAGVRPQWNGHGR
jgi:hypothetical protein